MRLRLHSRLVALNAAALVLVTLLLGQFLGSSLQTTLVSEIEGQLHRSASMARVYIQSHPEKTDPTVLANEIGRALDLRVTLIAPDGRVLGDSEVTPAALPAVENHSNRPEFIQARQTGRGVAVRTSSTVGGSLIYLAIVLDDGTVLRLATPLSTMAALLGNLRRQLILAVFIGVVATFVLGYMVYRVVSLPLRRLAEASMDLAYGNLKTEIPVTGDRDLAVVGASLNTMAKRLQQRLEELHADKVRIEAIVTAMSAGVVVFEPDRRVVLANQAVRGLLGLAGDPRGRMPLELLRNPSVEAAVRGALAGEEVPPVDVATGSGKVLFVTARPVRSAAGSVDLAVVVFHDLTEIRRTERMRKDFIANVSHEFKTPLTSIKGYTETLLNSPPDDAATSREFLEAIQRNASLLQAMVDDLLMLARLESEPPVEKQRFSVREMLEGLVRSREHLLKEKPITVELDCPEAEIVADRDRLERATANLIDNAIHYNRPGGRIRLAGREAGRGFAIEVSDTGRGIPQEDLSRIFERFYRVDKSRLRDSGGTGLGLSIVKHAIESQGGTISVTSKLGSGSTFTIVLPG